MFGKASTYVETVDINELESASSRLLAAINYYGLVELEYKLDPRDGSYNLLDFNARIRGYHRWAAVPALTSRISSTGTMWASWLNNARQPLGCRGCACSPTCRPPWESCAEVG